MGFLIVICFIAIVISIAYALETKESKKEEKEIENIIKSHTYTEIEYLELYNYCINIRNSFIDMEYSITRNKIIEKWDSVLHKCKIIYEQPYYTKNYNNLCIDLLNLLDEYNYSIKKINYGILDYNHKNEDD